MIKFNFEIEHVSKKSNARVGVIKTSHGDIQTPGFVSVGTNGTLKSLDPISAACQIPNQELMFCNTYHLLLHPGADIIEQAGGIHSFINRNKPIITDSGGFQVFSMAYGGVANELKSQGKKNISSSVIKVNEEGVIFRSYRDGNKIHLTPESSVIAQKKIGADIIIPFDELLPYNVTEKKMLKSLDRTHRWEKRSLDQHLNDVRGQAMYGVIHGGLREDLRKTSSVFVSGLPFDGYAIGGSLGKNTEDVVKVLKYTKPYLSPHLPVHLLGIGDIATINESVSFGIDTFDSSYPNKIARHGCLLNFNKAPIKVLSNKWKNNFNPIDSDCSCYTCKNYSLSYIHHLFKAHEQTAFTLATIHNLSVMTRHMEWIRSQIKQNKI